jgi:hypothetical protein
MKSLCLSELGFRKSLNTGFHQLPIQWVPGALSLGVKRLWREANHSDLVPRLRIHGAISPLPNMSSWRGSKLNTGTTLPFRGVPDSNRAAARRRGRTDD